MSCGPVTAPELLSVHNVRQKFIHYGTTLVLTLCLWGHVSEIFDHWDNTFRTGTDVEYSIVIVALAAGAVIALARAAATVLRGVGAAIYLASSSAPQASTSPTPATSTIHSPPQPLRI